MSTIIAMISENTEEHVYCVQWLYQALNEDISQQSLSQVAIWTIGEFGDLLITGQMEIEGDTLDMRRMGEALIPLNKFMYRIKSIII